jgi:hypothetical protein
VETGRASAIAVLVVGRAFLRQPEAIVNKPGELAFLFRSLTTYMQVISPAFIETKK